MYNVLLFSLQRKVKNMVRIIRKEEVSHKKKTKRVQTVDSYATNMRAPVAISSRGLVRMVTVQPINVPA